MTFRLHVGLVLTLVLLAGCDRGFNLNRTAPSPQASVVSPVPSVSPSPTVTTPNPKPELTQSVERRLTTLLTETLTVEPTSIQCPDKEKAQPGDRTQCQVSVAAQTFPVEIEFTNSSGAFKWQTKDLIILSKLETFIQNTVKERSEVNVTVNCGGAIRVTQAGETFECGMSDQQGRTRPIKVTVKDSQGRVDVTL